MPFDQTVEFKDAKKNLLFDSLVSIWLDIAFPWFLSLAYCEISYWLKDLHTLISEMESRFLVLFSSMRHTLNSKPDEADICSKILSVKKPLFEYRSCDLWK